MTETSFNQLDQLKWDSYNCGGISLKSGAVEKGGNLGSCDFPAEWDATHVVTNSAPEMASYYV